MQTKKYGVGDKAYVHKCYYLFYGVLRSRALLCGQEALAVAPP